MLELLDFLKSILKNLKYGSLIWKNVSDCVNMRVLASAGRMEDCVVKEMMDLLL